MKIFRLFFIYCIVYVFASGGGKSYGQSQGRLELFYGGIVSADLRVASTGLNAFSGTFAGIGGSFSQLTPGGESVRWNPVGLAYIHKSQLYSEWVPPLKVNLNPLLKIENRANTELRSSIRQYVPEGKPLDLKEFVINPKIFLDGGQGSYAAIMKTRKFTIGGAVHNPTRFRADIALSGMKFRAVTEPGSGGTTIRLLGILNGTISTEFSLSGLSLAIGRKLWRGLGLGIAFDSFSASVNASGFFQPEAQVSSGSEEYAFNSANANHYDKLQASGRGAFSGEGGRWRLGVGYHHNDQYAFDVGLFLPSEIDFGGQLKYTYDQILAINLKADDNSAFFDANQLLDDQFTGTHPRWTTIDGLQLTLPGQIALAAAFGWRGGRASAIFVSYFGRSAINFRYSSAGDSTTSPSSGSWEIGLEPKEAIYTNLGAHWLQVRLGALKLAWRSQSSRDESKPHKAFWLPILGFSGGFTFPYFKKFRMDYALSLGITSFLRLGTTYAF